MTDEKYQLETLKVEPDDIVKITFKDFPIKEAMDFFRFVKSQFPDNTVIAVFEDSCDIVVEKPVVKTNYDRIKNMSVEEMSDFMANHFPVSFDCSCNLEPLCRDKGKFDDYCVNAFYQWLNSEVNITQLNRVKRFECKSCGCVFEAGKTEYRSNSQYNETYYYCECPFCKKDTGVEVICRSLLGILKNNGDLNDVIEE